MTPEQIESEAAFAKKIYEEDMNASPDEIRKTIETLKLHRRSKAAGLINQERSPIK
jgi:hypothetical protein